MPTMKPIIHVDNLRVFKLGFCMVFLGFICCLPFLSLSVVDDMEALESSVNKMDDPISKETINKASISSATARKLLAFTDGDGGNGDYGSSPSRPVNRIGDEYGGSCSKEDILVVQGQTPPLPNGIPTYTVHVQNTCAPSGQGSNSCTISNIHLKCGWFSSARLTNPKVFRRISYDDCLVNDGQALNPGETLYFQYANTFPYDMVVSSVTCQ